MPSNLFLLKICISLLGEEVPIRNSAATRKRWSKEEEEELLKLFPKCFAKNATKKQMCPNEKMVLAAMDSSKKENGAIFRNGRKVWSTIKKKVYRMAKSGDYIQDDENENIQD